MKAEATSETVNGDGDFARLTAQLGVKIERLRPVDEVGLRELGHLVTTANDATERRYMAACIGFAAADAVRHVEPVAQS